LLISWRHSKYGKCSTLSILRIAEGTIYFPGKYLDMVYSLDIDEAVKEKIRSTRNVGKSKPCIFEIRNNEMLKDFTSVMELKIRCK